MFAKIAPQRERKRRRRIWVAATILSFFAAMGAWIWIDLRYPSPMTDVAILNERGSPIDVVELRYGDDILVRNHVVENWHFAGMVTVKAGRKLEITIRRSANNAVEQGSATLHTVVASYRVCDIKIGDRNIEFIGCTEWEGKPVNGRASKAGD